MVPQSCQYLCVTTSASRAARWRTTDDLPPPMGPVDDHRRPLAARRPSARGRQRLGLRGGRDRSLHRLSVLRSTSWRCSRCRNHSFSKRPPLVPRCWAKLAAICRSGSLEMLHRGRIRSMRWFEPISTGGWKVLDYFLSQRKHASLYELFCKAAFEPLGSVRTASTYRACGPSNDLRQQKRQQAAASLASATKQTPSPRSRSKAGWPSSPAKWTKWTLMKECPSQY